MILYIIASHLICFLSLTSFSPTLIFSSRSSPFFQRIALWWACYLLLSNPFQVVIILLPKTIGNRKTELVRLRSRDKHHLRKSADRQGQISHVLVSPRSLPAHGTRKATKVWSACAWSWTCFIRAFDLGAGPSATHFLKRLAGRISERHANSYSETVMWLRTKLSFALLRSSIMCLRGSRPHRSRVVRLDAIQLATSEAGLWTFNILI